MGYKANLRMIYIAVCLLVAAFFTYYKSSARIQNMKMPLSEAFASVQGWQTVGDVDLQRDVVDALNLDDYLFRSYRRGNYLIFLYIGYYRSADKIGAAHSPLVCFPGQGWEISRPQKLTFSLESGKINLAKLIASKGQQQELILYWFQSFDETSNGTLQQKFKLFWGRLNSAPEDNAFVRVSVPIQNNNIEDAYNTAAKFLQDFYPNFFNYIKN